MRENIVDMFKVRCDVYGMEIDEAMAALALTSVYMDSYVQMLMPVPEWVGQQRTDLQDHIQRKNRDALARRLRSAKSRLAAAQETKDPEGYLSKEIAALEQQLQGTLGGVTS